MIKKIFTFRTICFIFIALMILMVNPQITHAYTSGGYLYDVSGNNAKITKYNGTLDNITIPATLGVYAVTSIEQYAFADCTKLTSVIIPNSVISIGVYAFNGCTSLTSVNIPNSVTTIGKGAFYNCSKLTSVTIGTGLKNIGYDMFRGCTSLTSVTIGSNVTSIDQYAFADCTNLTSVNIPNSVISIGEFAFYNCSKLTSAKFFGNSPTMGKSVFYGCATTFKVNYFYGKKGYTNPWYGYQTIQISSINYTLTYNINDGTGTTPTAIISSSSSKITLPTKGNIFKTGYTFTGWNTSLSRFDGTHYNAGVSYTTRTENVTLYAEWTPQTPLANVQRLAGINRIETSIAIAKEQYTYKAPDAVVLATSNNFADALAGSGLAYKHNAPLLLVNKTVSNSKTVLEYITTNLSKNKTIYILGGIGAISKEISDYLTEKEYNIIRLGGNDRYETNQKIVDYLDIYRGTSVVIATGASFADALSISSIADIKGFPILLNGKNSLLDSVSNDITNIKPTTVYIIGGIGVLSTNIENQINRLDSKIAIVRLGGSNRYETSMKIIEHFNLTTNMITVATGIDFPDALSGSVLAARKNCGVLLVDNKEVTKQKDLLSKQKITNVILFGGEGVISDDIATSLAN